MFVILRSSSFTLAIARLKIPSVLPQARASRQLLLLCVQSQHTHGSKAGRETSVFRAKRHSCQQNVTIQAIVGDVQAKESVYTSVIGRDDGLAASDTVQMTTLQTRSQRSSEKNHQESDYHRRYCTLTLRMLGLRGRN